MHREQFVCRHALLPALIRGPAASVGMLFKGDDKPGTARADARAYFRRMLADAGREHEAVGTPQGSCQRANLACGAEYEQVHGFMRKWIAGAVNLPAACP